MKKIVLFGKRSFNIEYVVWFYAGYDVYHLFQSISLKPWQ